MNSLVASTDQGGGKRRAFIHAATSQRNNYARSYAPDQKATGKTVSSTEVIEMFLSGPCHQVAEQWLPDRFAATLVSRAGTGRRQSRRPILRPTTAVVTLPSFAGSELPAEREEATARCANRRLPVVSKL
jgi:hypothetical protein